MKNTAEPLEQNEGRFERMIARQELRQLRREESHLLQKSKERPLTPWEVTRFQTLTKEIMDLISDITERV